MHPELQVILFTLGVILLGYLSIMPKIAGNNVNRLIALDIVFAVFVLGVVGAKFSGLDIRFSLIVLDTNWFLFSLICYLCLESPLAYWYIKTYRVQINKF